MKKLLVLGTVAASLVLACAAYAYPTLNGPTGYGVQPNAKVACTGTLDLAGDLYNIQQGGDLQVYPIRATYGVTPNLEIGGAYTFVDDQYYWNANAKYVVKLAGLDVALGGQYFKFSMDDINALQCYAAGDIKIGGSEGPNANLTLGANWTQLNGIGTVDAFRGFAGIDVCLCKGLNIVGDYQTKSNELNEPQAMYSAALRFALTPSMTLQGGYTNSISGVGGSDDSNYFVGFNYNFVPMATE